MMFDPINFINKEFNRMHTNSSIEIDIKQRDSSSEFSNSPIYLSMLQWFLDHDNEETRKSLKNWVGSNPTYGIGKSLESNVSDVMSKTGLKGTDKTKSLTSTSNPQEKGDNQDLINKQKDAINILNKVIKSNLIIILSTG